MRAENTHRGKAGFTLVELLVAKNVACSRSAFSRSGGNFRQREGAVPEALS